MSKPASPKPIEFSKAFQKNLIKRFGNQPKVVAELRTRLMMFNDGIRDVPLSDHALKGKMKGLRAFSVSGNIRVIYEETGAAYILRDIGTHNQVYK
jgi:mRNA-degrading endonuclease YafQ of YafQ-DinJ toxin-antitoxin module